MKKWFWLLIALFSLPLQAQTVVVIDAGHGGKDPGGIGKTLNLQEKAVTLAISQELKALFDADPHFNAVMTRSEDEFISIPQRAEIADKHRADYFLSIHADVDPHHSNSKGASVWISNGRLNDEMPAKFVKHQQHLQTVSNELGEALLSQLKNVTTLAKSMPKTANISLLSLQNTASVLVEVGYISNAEDEQKLATLSYQKKLAQAIYLGLVEHQRNQLKQTAKQVINAANAQASGEK